jgi:hypothetical protein
MRRGRDDEAEAGEPGWNRPDAAGTLQPMPDPDAPTAAPSTRDVAPTADDVPVRSDRDRMPPWIPKLLLTIVLTV